MVSTATGLAGPSGPQRPPAVVDYVALNGVRVVTWNVHAFFMHGRYVGPSRSKMRCLQSLSVRADIVQILEMHGTSADYETAGSFRVSWSWGRLRRVQERAESW